MTAVLFAALIWKMVDFLRLLLNASTNKSAILTQAVAFAAGIGGVAVGAHAAITENVVIPGTGLAMGLLDAGSIILAGLLVASLGSVAVDFKQAFDGTDSAAKPPLLKS